MAQPPPVFPLTADDYLRWEADQPEKHEYVRGKTFAMGGASRRHVKISLNVASALDEALDGTPSRAYIADMKVQATEDEAYFYPDVLVTCDPADHRADQFMRAPKLIVEVLSPSTEGIDRRATPPAVVAFQPRKKTWSVPNGTNLTKTSFGSLR